MALLRVRCAGRSRPQRRTEEGQAMYGPYGPLGCWTLCAGEDGQYLSQPPVIWDGDRMIPITGHVSGRRCGAPR